MRWGDHKAALEKLSAENGKTPAALINRPELFDDLVEIWEAWQTLGYSRNMNGVIPFSEIKAYAEAKHIDDIDLLTRYIYTLESAYMKEKEKTKSEKHP